MPDDPKVAAYLKSAEDATPPEMTSREKSARIRYLKTRLDGVKVQFVNEGQKLKKAKVEKNEGVQRNCENLLADNLKLRRELVTELRSLGETVDDSLSG